MTNSIPRRSILFVGSAASALALLLLVFTLVVGAAGQNAGDKVQPAASIRDLVLGEQGLSFALQTPIVPLPLDGVLEQPGLNERFSTPGLPSLPYYSTYVVLPPEGQPQVSVSHLSQEIVRNVFLPAASPEIVRAQPMLGDTALGLSPSPLGDPEFTAAATTVAVPDKLPSGLHPARFVEISEPMMFRDVRLARVSIYPVRYDSQHQLLSVLPEIGIRIEFNKPDRPVVRRLAPSHADQHLASLAGSVLNPEQIQDFRSLPEHINGTGEPLPQGKDLFKIAVSQEGIYQLTYEALKDAGMAVDLIDPATLEMQYRGVTVATDFSGDSDENFEAGESLRFYGYPFSGSRLERQFINDNIFWLWAGQEASTIIDKPSVSGDPVSTHVASLTREPEEIYFQGFTADWPENEPDAWYWDWLPVGSTPLTRTYTMTLPNPSASGPPAVFTAEFSSRDSHIANQFHSLSVTMNGYPSVAGHDWWGEKNFNVSATVPMTSVIAGTNSFEVTAKTAGVSAHIVLNRITVDYLSSLTAVGDQLIFSDQAGGQREYGVRGFSQSNAADVLAWDITSPYSPTAIVTPTIAISGDGPYTYTFGLAHTGNAKIIVTTQGNVLAPTSIQRYVAPSLDPPGGADWVAIAFRQFITETQRLATHRSQASFGGLKTHVVDIEHITNQYGYGLPIPAAIQSYLAHALATWEVKPSYVVLVGDTTLDPRHVKDDWEDQQYVPTDLVFVDRYNGQIPSDLTFALVSGSDVLPDLSLGRIAVETVEELVLAIDKIIRYDENQLLSFGWMQNMLFVADADDPTAGAFCNENQLLADRLPPSLNSMALCLDHYDGSAAEKTNALRDDLKAALEDTGVTMLTYRGHGAIANWGGNPPIFSLEDAAELQNRRPFVAISGDCLDGHFAYPPWEGLGERLFNSWAPADEIYGAAAHWGSSGLGLSSDHSDILDGFYDGLFSTGLTAIGDAANHAKLQYALDPWNDPALMYSFNLQGDPAMHLMRPEIELEGDWQQKSGEPGEQVTMSLHVQNHGVYPAQVTLTADALDGFSVSAIASTVDYTASNVGGGTRIVLQFGPETNEYGLPRNGEATVTLTYNIAPDATLGPRSARFATESSGFEGWPGDETVVNKISVLKRSIWLPALNR